MNFVFIKNEVILNSRFPSNPSFENEAISLIKPRFNVLLICLRYHNKKTK